MIDIFFKDSTVTIEGRQVPTCWTETVNDGLDEQSQPINERREILSEWDGFHCPPVIGTAPDGDSIFHLMGTTQQADFLSDAEVLLGRDYFTLQVVHPDLAYRCIEVEYLLNGEPGRCKYSNIPLGASIQAVYAPSKYLGVESPTTPEQPTPGIFPTQLVEASTVDLTFIELKEEVKPFALPYIKSHPSCTITTLLTAIKNGLSLEHSAAAQIMLTKYAINAADKGIIKDKTFESLRDLIVATPVETLMEYLK